jgi:hypothetical protein
LEEKPNRPQGPLGYAGVLLVLRRCARCESSSLKEQVFRRFESGALRDADLECSACGTKWEVRYGGIHTTTMPPRPLRASVVSAPKTKRVQWYHIRNRRMTKCALCGQAIHKHEGIFGKVGQTKGFTHRVELDNKGFRPIRAYDQLRKPPKWGKKVGRPPSQQITELAENERITRAAAEQRLRRAKNRDSLSRAGAA